MAHRLLVSLTVSCCATVGCNGSTFDLIHEGMDIQSDVRAALAENGTVVATTPSSLLVGDGGPSTSIDLTPQGLDLTSAASLRRVQVLSSGEIVFVAQRSEENCARGFMLGAYLRTTAGNVTPLAEECKAGDTRFDEIAMSPNGTVVTSSIAGTNNDGNFGAVLRGPVTGPPCGAQIR